MESPCSPHQSMQTHSFTLTSWVCIVHFSLRTPNSLCAFRGGCASHCALFTAGNAALGEEQAFRGGLGDGFQVLSEACSGSWEELEPRLLHRQGKFG